MPTDVTEGIRVTVEATYLPDRSSPDEGSYAFAYTVMFASDKHLLRRGDVVIRRKFGRAQHGERVAKMHPGIEIDKTAAHDVPRITLGCVDELSAHDQDRTYVDECQERYCEFVVPCRDSAKLLELREKAFDAVAFAVGLFVQWQGIDGIAAIRNDRHRAIIQERISRFLSVIPFVQHCFFRMAIAGNSPLELSQRAHIRFLSRRQHKGDGSVLVRRRDV